MTRFLLIRHGESEGNLLRLFTGHGDLPLTARGRAQAALAATRLRSEKIDAAWASDLSRAWETAEIICRPHGVPVKRDARLREILAGDWEGRTFEYLHENGGAPFETWMRDIGACRCPGGESVAEMQSRVAESLRDIARQCPGQNVLVGIHATPLRAMCCMWLGFPLSRMHAVPWVANASVTVVDYEDDACRLVAMGEDKHLLSMKTELPQKRHMSLSHPFAPVYDASSRVLVLGTFPSVKSREAAFYYGHPQNRFWPLLARLFGEITPASVPDKKALLLRHGVALWDVVARCDITLSGDASIRNAFPNDIPRLLRETGIRRVFANGAMAETLYNRLVLPDTSLAVARLPSTSPANCRVSPDALAEAWRVIL